MERKTSRESSLKQVKEDFKFLQLDSRFISAMAEKSFVWYNSSPRLVMVGQQDYQKLKTKRADRKIVQTGLEFQLGEYSFKKILKTNSKIVGIIPRYECGPTNDTVNKVVEITILYIDLETKQLKHIELTTFNKIHSYFGFEYEWDMETIDSLNVNETIKEDLELAKSGNVADDDYYKYGCLLNVINISSNESAEDGMQIRKSALEKFKFDIYIKAKIQYGPNDVLANLYGDENHYKPVPEIGDKIHDSGALIAIKKFSPPSAAALLSNRNLREFDPNFDKAYYVKGSDGIVEDIKVFYSPDNKTKLFNSDILLKYNRALKKYYKHLYEAYKREDKNSKIRFDRHIDVAPETHRLLVNAQAFLNLSDEKDEDAAGIIKGYFKKNELNVISAEYTIKYTITPFYGSKFTDNYASKSVIVDIVDDKFMPDGVDVIIEAKTIVSRMIGGGGYEHYYNDASRQNREKILDILQNVPELREDEAVGYLLKQVREEYESLGIDNQSYKRTSHKELIKMLRKLSKESLELIYDFLLGMIKMFQEAQYFGYKDATHEDKITILYQIITEELIIFSTNDEKTNDDKPPYIVQKVEASEYKPLKKPVVYKNADGTLSPTIDNVRIAPKYLMLLCKLPEEMNSCSSPHYNHHALPTQPSSVLKTRYPSEDRPTRKIGETEGRAYAAYVEESEEALGTLINRANNIDNHSSICRQILDAPEPTNIEKLEESFEGNGIIQTVTNALRTAGVELRYKEDNWYEK